MHCEQCRRPLQHAHEICQACNQELPYPTSSNSNKALGVGRYRCPACNGFFDRWATTLFPRDAHWYTPQSEVATCPLCEEALQWKRDTEPAQLSAGFEGIALGTLWALLFTIPSPLPHGIKEHLGAWFAALVLVLLVAMYYIATRPFLQGTGCAPGRFVLAQPQPQPVGKRFFWASWIIGAVILVSVRAAPQAAQFSMWCAWLGLAAAGCLAAVVWRRSVERHQRLHTPDPAAPSPTRLP
jgi:membrane protein implicated in regulation of membrane protease activity